MNGIIAIESLANTLGNECAPAITAQNGVKTAGGGNYLSVNGRNFELNNAARAAFSVVAPQCFFYTPNKRLTAQERTQTQ